jgi:hypothetical protein
MVVRIAVSTKPRWFTWLLLVPLFVIAAVFGLVVLLVALGLVLAAALWIGLRLWWLRRGVRAHGDQIIEGEYVVVRETRRDDQPPR